MVPRGSGTIVNTASTSAIRGRAGLSGYVASKHAVLGLTRTAALEVAGTSIRVNAILPGPIESRMIRELDAQASRNAQDFRRGCCPLRQAGKHRRCCGVSGVRWGRACQRRGLGCGRRNNGGVIQPPAPIFSETVFAALRSSTAIAVASWAGILSCRTSGTVRAATARPDASTTGQL